MKARVIATRQQRITFTRNQFKIGFYYMSASNGNINFPVSSMKIFINDENLVGWNMNRGDIFIQEGNVIYKANDWIFGNDLFIEYPRQIPTILRLFNFVIPEFNRGRTLTILL